ncbi:MAG: tRNA (cytidine(34)-2'-O)-methyltransferase [Nitratireductor sp.]|nr:tRNA (cytidine(34)-2'-O)-methyltransferase [Nitratireductor sp.]
MNEADGTGAQRRELSPELALYQPDIAGNTGTLLRLAACTGTVLNIIGPAGFRMDDAALRRAGMDYLEIAATRRHSGWEAFEAWRQGEGRRLVLLTTRASAPYFGFSFKPGDLILLGRESAGVPDEVHAAADYRLLIPMAPGARSINVALSGGIVLAEALRQTGTWPPAPHS